MKIHKKLFAIVPSFLLLFIISSYVNFWPLALFATISILAILGMVLVNLVIDKKSMDFLEYILMLFGFGIFQAILFLAVFNFISVGISKIVCFAFLTIYICSLLLLSKRDIPSISFEKKHLLILVPIIFYFINAIPDALNHVSLPYRDSYDLTYQTAFAAKYHKTFQAYTNELTVYLHGFDLFLGFISNMIGVDAIIVNKWFAIFFVPLTQIAIYVLCFKLTKRTSVAVGAALLLSSPYFFDWLFLRTAITRPENIGLFLFSLILVWLTYRKEIKPIVFRLVLFSLFAAVFAVHMLSALYLLLLIPFVLLYDMGFRKTGILISATLAMFLLYFYMLDWNLFIFLQGLTYPLSSFNFAADYYTQNTIVILQLVGIYMFYMLRKRKFYSNLQTFAIFGTWLVMTILYYLLPYAFQAAGQETPFLIYRTKSYIEILVVVISSIGLSAVLNFCRRYEMLETIHSKIQQSHKMFGRIRFQTLISISWIAFLLFVPAVHLPAQYIDYTAVSDQDFQTLQSLKDYCSDNEFTGNFSVMLVGNGELETYFTNYEDFLDSLFGSRRLYSKSNGYVWEMYSRDPPYLYLILNETEILTEILYSEEPMFFVISDRISEDFSENARDILEMVNAKNISDSKIYLFGYEQGFNLEKEVWSHDVLSSDLWKTWRATKASNSNNTGVLIQVANDQPSGAFSLYGSEGWSLDAQTSQIFEFKIDSLSSNTYQIFAKNAEGEKFILYDGNKTGTILCNAFSESIGVVLNELHVYIRGNGTLLELNHIIFYSFK